MPNDAPRPSPKPSPELGPLETLIGAAILLALGYYVQDLLYAEGGAPQLVQRALGIAGSPMWSAVLTYLKFVAVVIVIAGVFVVGWMIVRLNRIRVAEREKYGLKKRTAADEAAEQPARNKQWDRVMDHISSDRQNDWKLAIMEADIMLYDMLDTMGYRGDSLGEKLKQVERSDFSTLENAWEAHKVRNRIAHEGEEFAISQIEARRIIELFRSVFEEFHYI